VFRRPKCYISKITFTKNKTLEISGQVLTEAALQEINKELNKMVYDEDKDNPKAYFTYVVPKSRVEDLPLQTSTMKVQGFTFTCHLWNPDNEGKRFF
jgi:hypothetical protein